MLIGEEKPSEQETQDQFHVGGYCAGVKDFADILRNSMSEPEKVVRLKDVLMVVAEIENSILDRLDPVKMVDELEGVDTEEDAPKILRV